MSYDPTTDFLALVRHTASGEAIAKMPGLDYVLSAMARAGLFTLSVGQVAPTTNQATTVWLKPALPSYTAEGIVYLWNPLTSAYEVATPALWNALLVGVPYLFQSAAGASNIVAPSTSIVAVQRAAPSTTVLTLPTLASRLGKALQVADWSTGVVDHSILLNPVGGATIMRQPAWVLRSTPDQLAGVTLYPSTDLNGWIIAP